MTGTVPRLSSARPSRPAAVVMVTHERPPDPRLWAGLPGEVELLVVADNSTTETIQAEIARQCQSSPIPHVLIQNRANIGLARALNRSVAAARDRGCETVFILDHDATVDPTFFRSARELLEQLESEAGFELGAVVPIVSDLTPSLAPPEVAGSWSSVGSIITSGTLVRISTFDALGGFDERLFVEGVDLDFAERMRASGRTLARLNRVLVRQAFGQPFERTSSWTRLVERFYAAYYFVDVLSGRSNSFHTRLARYSVERRAELVRYQRRGAANNPSTAGRPISRWFSLLGTLLFDSLASGDWTYLGLALRQ